MAMKAETVTWMKMSITVHMHKKSQLYTLTTSLLKLNKFTRELSTKKMPTYQKPLSTNQNNKIPKS